MTKLIYDEELWGKVCHLGEGRACRRDGSCSPTPWTYEGEIIKCGGCGKDMCKWEVWGLAKTIDKIIIVCFGCGERVAELDDLEGK